MAEEAEAAAAAEASEEKSKKDPKPEGWTSPVEFAKLWSAKRAGGKGTLEEYENLDEEQKLRPQIIYGYIRNNKAFAEAAVDKNTDGHLMVNTKAGFKFLEDRDKTRAAKAAEKEAAEAASEK